MLRRKRFVSVAASCFSLLLALTVISEGSGMARSAHDVSFDRIEEGWQLTVDEKPYFIRGVGCNTARGQHGEDYLQMAKEMGANTVRTWGIVPVSYLDEAAGLGLMVDVGFWLEPVRSWSKHSYRDPKYCDQVRSQILSYIHNMKDHPAVLMWNVGNETFTYTESDEEKAAFGEFFRQLLHEIHQEDPAHPVVFSSSEVSDVPFLKTYAPTLDAVGFNTSKQVSLCLNWLGKNGYDKPAFISEYGPAGAWERPADDNNVPWDVPDHIKAEDYVSMWRQIESMPGRCFGGFAFVMGEQRNQDSLTWFNINLGRLKRDAYWAIRQLYTGQPPLHRPPHVRQFRLDGASHLDPGQWVTATTDAVNLDGGRLHYDYFVTNISSDPLVVDPPVYYPTTVEPLSPGVARLRVPKKPGVYRVYVSVTDDYENVAVGNQSIQVDRR